MKELDFLPPWYVAAQRGRRDAIIRIAYLGVVVGAMVVLAAVRQVQSASAAAALSDMRREREDGRTTAGSLVTLQSRCAELERKQRLTADIQGGARMHGVLAEITAMLPEAVAITSLHVVEGPRIPVVQAATAGPQGASAEAGAAAGGRIEIRGMAAADRQIGQLMGRMSGSAALAEVKLNYCKPVEIAGRKAREFELACRLPQFE